MGDTDRFKQFQGAIDADTIDLREALNQLYVAERAIGRCQDAVYLQSAAGYFAFRACQRVGESLRIGHVKIVV